MDSLLNLLLTGLVGMICLVSGRALLFWMGFRFVSQSEGVVLSAGVGFGVLVYAMVLLGVAGLYRPAAAWGLLSALALLGALRWRHISWRLDWGGPLGKLHHLPWSLVLLLAMLSVYGLSYLVVGLTPTLEGDSLAGYLLTAREYARQGGIVSLDYAYTDHYPANGQMLSTLGFLLRGQILAQLLLVWLMGLLVLAVIYAFGQAWLSRRAALVAIVAWYGMTSVGYLAASGKVDLAWAAFDLLALLAFSRWYFSIAEGEDWRWLALAGFFLGLAGGIKQTSVFTAVVLSAAVAVCLRQAGSHRLGAWMRAYAALGLPAGLAVLWVIRTYLMTGTLAFTGENLPGDAGLFGFFRTLWGMSMLGNAPSVEGSLGKPIGPIILAVVPLLVLFRNLEGRVRHILAFCGLMLVLWFNGVQRARHLLPTLALLFLLAGYVVTLLLTQRPRLGQIIVVCIVFSLSLNLGTWGYINLISLQRLPYVLGLQDADGYLEANLSKSSWYANHAILTYARDHLPPEARIAALSSGNSYYLERPFYTEWTETQADIPEPADFAEKLRASGITHVFVNDYAIRARHLEGAWLAQPEFETQYLDELICAEEQCLYGVR